MFYHLDNFEIYDTVRTSGNIDPQWLNRVFSLKQTTVDNLVITQWDGGTGRVGLGTRVATTGQRSVYLPVGQYITEARNKINVSQKLLDFKVGPALIGGVSIVSGELDQHILGFGFSTTKTGFVRYVGPDQVVREEVFTLTTALSLEEDTIEWGFEKAVNDASAYRSFSLWVNNKPAYVGTIFNQVGSSGALAVRVHGAVSSLAPGATSGTGFLNSAVNVSIPVFGTTDLVVNDGARNGLVRVLSRGPTADLGPNSMTPNIMKGSHAEVVANKPPTTGEYLTAVTAAAEELFGSGAYTDLSSEAVLAVALQVVSQKNNPFAMDLEGTLRLSGVKRDIGLLPVDLTPGFTSVIMDRNPFNGLAWTALEANSVNFGIKAV